MLLVYFANLSRHSAYYLKCNFIEQCRLAQIQGVGVIYAKSFELSFQTISTVHFTSRMYKLSMLYRTFSILYGKLWAVVQAF